MAFGPAAPGQAVPPVTSVRIFPIPPPMSCVAVRPLFLDTALHALPLPSVGHRTGRAEAPASRIGRLTAGLWKAGGYLAGKK